MVQLLRTSCCPIYTVSKATSADCLANSGYSFSPILISGGVGDPGIYNLPTMTPVTTKSVTYIAAGVPVSDTYTGTTVICWPTRRRHHHHGEERHPNKYVIATGSDGYGRCSPPEKSTRVWCQPVLVAYGDTAGQLGPKGGPTAWRECRAR